MGLRPRPRWESLQPSPDPLIAFNGPISRGRKGGEAMGGSPGSSDFLPGCRVLE